jgi:hypothetical protein
LGYNTLGYDTLMAHHGNEQVGDARRAHVAEAREKPGELLAIDTLERWIEL